VSKYCIKGKNPFFSRNMFFGLGPEQGRMRDRAGSYSGICELYYVKEEGDG
jgi:hypothetical protein